MGTGVTLFRDSVEIIHMMLMTSLRIITVKRKRVRERACARERECRSVACERAEKEGARASKREPGSEREERERAERESEHARENGTSSHKSRKAPRRRVALGVVHGGAGGFRLTGRPAVRQLRLRGLPLLARQLNAVLLLLGVRAPQTSTRERERTRG